MISNYALKGRYKKKPRRPQNPDPLKILKRTCTPLKLRETIKTPPKFWEQNMDTPKQIKANKDPKVSGSI